MLYLKKEIRVESKRKKNEEKKKKHEAPWMEGWLRGAKKRDFFLQESKMNIRNSGWVGKNRVKIKAKEKNLFSFISFIQMRQLCCQEILSY